MTDDAPSNDSDLPPGDVTVRRLLGLAVPEIPLLIPATLALLISAGIMLVTPKLIGLLVGRALDGSDGTDLDTLAGLLVVAFLVQSIFGMVRAWLFTLAGERLVARLRGDLYQAIIRQDVGFFDRAKTGELTNRLAADTTVLQNALTVNISMALRFGVTAVGSVVLILYLSPQLAAVALAIVPVVAVGAFLALVALLALISRLLTARVRREAVEDYIERELGIEPP